MAFLAWEMLSTVSDTDIFRYWLLYTIFDVKDTIPEISSWHTEKINRGHLKKDHFPVGVLINPLWNEIYIVLPDTNKT